MGTEPTSLGKKIRIRRLFDASGFMLTVPMDHGITLGPIKGLDQINKTVRSVFQGGASSVVVQKGMVRTIYDQIPQGKSFMIHVSGSTSMSPTPNLKLLTGSVGSALKLGADGISCHVNVGCDFDSQMISDLNFIVEEAEDVGLPVLAMMYARNNDGEDSVDVNSLSHIARIAEEIGSDIVKINSTQNAEQFDEVTQGISIPIIVAGGSVVTDFPQFLETIKKCILAGATGVSIGRNVFQSNDPQLAMKKVYDTIISLKDEVDHVQAIY
ncbi:MAG: fructose-bisphosphate aldolase [Candidatus Heimdallarchaeota archaeon]|nr:fructose-bisphosphate aldolase [Candidatus Heimdallarchaeota archaeon]